MKSFGCGDVNRSRRSPGDGGIQQPLAKGCWQRRAGGDLHQLLEAPLQAALPLAEMHHRRAVADDPFFQRVHEKAAAETTAAEARAARDAAQAELGLTAAA